MAAFQKTDDLPWKPHALAEGVTIKPLVTRETSGTDVTCMLVRVPVGVVIPEHIHETQDDIVYPVSGKAKMYVEGTGEFELKPGVIVHVPKGMKHRIYDVSDELIAFDVFSPAVF